VAAPKCLFCGSMDTMPPFRKSERIPLLTALFPIRRRYCRECSRHFISFTRPGSSGRVYRTEHKLGDSSARGKTHI